jgi:NDP-sugar pyrophosphorylase family protein
MIIRNNTYSGQKLKVLILSNGHDFGRCPLASRLPASLWPVAGQTSMDSLLSCLAEQGIKSVFICSGQVKTLQAESRRADKRIEVKYLDEPLPVGTGGCIRQAAEKNDDSLFILIPSSLACPPDIEALINEHIESESDLTVFLEPECKENGQKSRRASGIYICNACVLEFIPEDGYCDIKEGLIPKMLRAGKSVHAANLSRHAGNFRDCHEYLQAVSNNIESIARLNNFHPEKAGDSCTLWTDGKVQVSPSARLAGQVALMDGVSISEGTVIIGPCIFGKNVTVGKDSIVINSILWDNARIDDNCCIDHCILDYNVNLRSFTKTVEQCIISKSSKINSMSGIAFKKANKKLTGNIQGLQVQI